MNPRYAPFFWSKSVALLLLSLGNMIASASDSIPKVIVTIHADPPIPDPVNISFERLDSTNVTFTSIHTAHRNWLQIEASPVGACQQVYIDSIRILDVNLSDTGSNQITSSPVIGRSNIPSRDARIWWHVAVAPASRVYCGDVTKSRRMLELPDPHVHAGTDSILDRWLLGRVEAIGPSDQVVRVEPVLLEQTGNDVFTVGCPMYSCVRLISANYPDTVARNQLLTVLREQISKGLPVVRITASATNTPYRETASIDDPAAVRSLGINSIWGRGNAVENEVLPIATARSWGGKNVPKKWIKPTGRRIYKWINNALCCDHCDSLCVYPGYAISSSGPDVELSNDSTRYCSPGQIDRNIVSDMASKDWLILPDSAEVRTGRLSSTFHQRVCGGRYNSYEISNDSLFGIPLVALEQMTTGVFRPASSLPLRIAVVPQGLRFSAEVPAGETWNVKAVSLSGQILTQCRMNGPELVLPLAGHGAVIIEVRTPNGAITRKVIR